jgi:hypothetical protein
MGHLNVVRLAASSRDEPPLISSATMSMERRKLRLRRHGSFVFAGRWWTVPRCGLAGDEGALAPIAPRTAARTAFCAAMSAKVLV